ncbi:MAG TPA: ThiF family adenylyltransferase [Gemmataceae bacterium]|nr:ThiF family adenylyltransferase [Gemmataceae bacterium]
MTTSSEMKQETDGGMVHTLSTGQQIPLPPHEEFYAQLITRNEGLVSQQDQERLRKAVILIAGCGSVGGAAIEPLIRFGAEHLLLAEPAEYDLHNMNRQSVRLQDVGRNKALVFQERMRDINPYASVEVDPRGIVAENVEALVGRSTLILDGVDVTTRPPLASKFALHREAKRFGVPVVAGYDIGGLQLLLIYDYRRSGTQVLNGRVRENEIDDLEPMVFLQRVIPLGAIPAEIIPELRRQLRKERKGFPQVVYTANLFGVLALPAVLELLARRPIRHKVILDVPHVLRPRSAQLRLLFPRLYGLFKLNGEFHRTQKSLEQ